MDPLKMYFLLKNGDIPASYVSLPKGRELQHVHVSPVSSHSCRIPAQYQPVSDPLSEYGLPNGAWWLVPRRFTIAARGWWIAEVDYHDSVVATPIFFIFTPIPGEMIQFDEYIFQMGWNHQPDDIVRNSEISSDDDIHLKPFLRRRCRFCSLLSDFCQMTWLVTPLRRWFYMWDTWYPAYICTYMNT